MQQMQSGNFTPFSLYRNYKGFNILQSWFLAKRVGVDRGELVCSKVSTNQGWWKISRSCREL